MPVTLSVRDVRDQLSIHANRDAADSNGAPSTRLLGQLFHDAFAELVEPSSRRGWRAAVAKADESLPAWKSAIIDHAYQTIVSRQLERAAPQLAANGVEVVRYWEAVQALCGWLADQLWTLRQGGMGGEEIEQVIQCEWPLSLELHEPGWYDTVELRGLADAVLFLPKRSAWCVAELKLGRTLPEVDLGQAALYYLMLSGGKSGVSPPGALAVVSFKPACQEQFLEASQLDAALARLKALIGRMAGVVGGEPSSNSTETTTSKRPIAGNEAAPKPHMPRPPARPLAWGQATEEHLQLGKELRKVFESHGLPVKVEDAPVVGPTFVRYFVQPQRGVPVRKFARLESDVALGLSLEKPPSIQRIGGRIAVDIERQDRQPVAFADLRPFLPEMDPLFGSGKILVGVDLDGQVEFIDLAQPEHCHVLVAGTAGSGKSQWLRAALLGLTETNTPQTLQLVLIDPKRNAFTAWRECPFLRRPLVFPDDTPVIEVLEELVEEMEDRYRQMEHVDDLRQLIERRGAPIPRIVCVCDEYADLLTGGREERRQIEKLLARLGAKARASGIHLVLATQRPSRDTVQGALKANLPAWVTLTVKSQIEARIMETPGAENLLNRGDLYFKSIGEPKRLQGALVNEEDLLAITASQAEPALVTAGNDE